MTQDSARYDRGLALFQKLHPEAAAAMQANLGDTAPDLMRYIAEFPFGDLYAREGLDPKLRQMATLAALATAGHIPQLKIHIGIALKLGFSQAEIVEGFMQLAPYAGFPATINAVISAKEVFESTA